jgi:uncharacterized membrane protein
VRCTRGDELAIELELVAPQRAQPEAQGAAHVRHIELALEFEGAKLPAVDRDRIRSDLHGQRDPRRAVAREDRKARRAADGEDGDA